MGTQTVRTNTVRNLGPVSEYPAHVGETEAAALHRLAAQAKARGVKIVVNLITNHHWATSASRPGTLHAVTLYSCDCAGFLRHARCMHYAAVLEMYHSLPAVEPVATGPDPTPDGGGEALSAPAVGAVLSIVLARSPLDQANRVACVAYLDSERDRDACWELTSSLLGEDYFRAGGLTDRALEAWCRTRLGVPTSELVCTSALCGGRGSFSQHPTDEGERCAVCRGAGVIPGHSVAVVAFVGQEVARAA